MKWWHVLIGVVCVLVLWAFIGILLPVIISETNQRGTFGDQFGAVNALFSGLAFAGVIYAVILQSKELELQRKELEQTREVLVDQKRQLEEQNKTMQQQRFEATFFQMLSLHNDIIDQMEMKDQGFLVRYGESGDIYRGRRCLLDLKQTLVGWIQEKPSKELGKVDLIHEAYKGFYEQYQHLIGHYFRNLYTIMKMVDRSQVENKGNYANVVRAQLSSSELVLLFYNCISPWGEKFKPLVEKYALLKNLPKGGLADERDRFLYVPSAFGEKERKV